jgi:hypothetical protein
MIKSYERLKKQNKEKISVPKSAQDLIDIDTIYKDGIFCSKNKYSKTYRFKDINYSIASKDEKIGLFLNYSELLNSLDSSVVRKIIDKFIGQLVHRLQDKKITISLTDQAYQMIQEEGFDPIYGARPLKRFIQSQIETKLAKEIIKGTVHQGQHVEVDYQDGFVLKAQ